MMILPQDVLVKSQEIAGDFGVDLGVDVPDRRADPF
jgi:hypothetical protein